MDILVSLLDLYYCGMPLSTQACNNVLSFVVKLPPCGIDLVTRTALATRVSFFMEAKPLSVHILLIELLGA